MQLSTPVRVAAAVAGLASAAACVVALGDRAWFSAFVLADLAGLCCYAVWRGRDPVADHDRTA